MLGQQRLQVGWPPGEDHRGAECGRGGGRPGDHLSRAVIATHRVHHDGRMVLGGAWYGVLGHGEPPPARSAWR